jgi:hypothetical protein
MPGGRGRVAQIDPGYLDIIGNSHMSDNVGASSADFGVAHKIDSFLQPALYRNVAAAAAVHSWHNQGNGASGDGGWAEAATQFDRQEQVYQRGATVTTAGPAAGASSIAVSDRSYFAPQQWVVLGKGTTSEIIQIASSYVQATGAGSITFATNTAQAHAVGDPIYYAPSNDGYLAKSSLVLFGGGINDLAVLGPYAFGVFGTDNGASRGLGPLQHAVRFTLAQMRCSVIFKYKHPSITYSASPAWSPLDVTSGASYPPTYWIGDPANGGLMYCTTVGGTVTVSTPPDFPGGTVALFLWTGNGGQGATYDLSVTGATTRSTTSAIQAYGIQAVTKNDAAGQTTAKHLGSVLRVKSLNPGVNTITLTSTTISAYSTFLGWGIEAPIPPQILVMPDPRAYDYSAYTTGTNTGYGPRAMAGAKTATVAAGAGTAAGSVTLGSAVTLSTTGVVSPSAAQPGDTITIGTGATQETRRIVAFASTTTLSVDAPFAFAHTAEAVKIGLQDADLVGGGYANTADTQGATSVPGVMAALQSVVNEFDSFVKISNIDAFINAPGRGQQTISRLNYAPDGLHYNDQGAALIAAGVSKQIYNMPWTVDQISAPTVSNKRTYLGIYGDTGATPGTAQVVQFQNGWSNLYLADPSYPRSGYYKDMRTREVYVRLAIYNGTGLSLVFTLPIGYRPSGTLPFPAMTSVGPGVFEVTKDGSVILTSGYPGTTGLVQAYFSFLAEQ